MASLLLQAGNTWKVNIRKQQRDAGQCYTDCTGNEHGTVHQKEPNKLSNAEMHAGELPLEMANKIIFDALWIGSESTKQQNV